MVVNVRFDVNYFNIVVGVEEMICGLFIWEVWCEVFVFGIENFRVCIELVVMVVDSM